MTASTTTAAGIGVANTNLHGTLRYLSKRSKNSTRRHGNKQRLRAGRSSRGLLCKPFTPRSDRLHVRSLDNGNANTKATDGDNRVIPAATNTQNIKGEGTSSSEEVKPEISLPATQTNSTSTSANSNESEAPRKQDEKRKATIATQATTIFLHPADLKQCEEAEDMQKQALKKIENARRKVYNDQVQQIWGLYMYGLKHVLALNDLSDAPDAILPGNF